MTVAADTDGRPRPRPLAGVRILSLAEQFPGPYATLILADLGADVLLVERPAGGDPSRKFGDFFAALNRNKRSLAIDLKDPRMKALLLDLVRDSDVFLEGFRPGTMDRLGLGHPAVSAANDRIVYVSISGFGQTGPYRDRPAHDLSYQALAGMLAFVGDGVDVPQLPIADLAAGMFGAIAVLLGLHIRDRDGTGCFIDASMFDVLVSAMTTQLVPALNGGDEVVPAEPGYDVFRTEDGAQISVSVAHENHFWRNLCSAVGLPEYAELEQRERVRDRIVLQAALTAAFAARPLVEWTRLLNEGDVPFAPVLGLEEVAVDPQVEAREVVISLSNGDGVERYISQPLVVDGRRYGPTRGVPALGEHSVDVLAAAGYTDSEIATLIREGVVIDGDTKRAAALG